MESLCQKAPSAKRCIKTSRFSFVSIAFSFVRKHRAPKGALRPGSGLRGWSVVPRQKAPSAIRCTKTPEATVAAPAAAPVRKHQAPKGALRPHGNNFRVSVYLRRQKAPSAKRCIKTDSHTRCRRSGYCMSESTERQKMH